MTLQQFVTSKKYKKFMGYLYGWGASVVILGALFKILHLPLANQMLIVGMGTEAIIFFFSAFEPLHIEPKWELVYPELADDAIEQLSKPSRKAVVAKPNEDAERLLGEKLDRMLQAARVDVSLFASLNSNINKLSEVASNIGTTVDVVSTNANYAKEVGKLSDTLAQLNVLYVNQLTASQKQIDIQAENTARQKEEQERLIAQQKAEHEAFVIKQKEDNARQSEEQARLFMRQREEQEAFAVRQREESGKIYAAMSQIADALSQSTQDSTAYKREIAELSEKMKSLNSLYANMLNALSGNKA